jgi:ribonuclease T1
VSTAGATIEFAPRASDLPPIGPAALPPEALDTLQRIATNGPYPYSNDGTVFENREGLLPSAESGYYREYTVETPGSADRGARRIVTGAGGELFYTDDHYDSFFEIVPGAG